MCTTLRDIATPPMAIGDPASSTRMGLFFSYPSTSHPDIDGQSRGRDTLWASMASSCAAACLSSYMES
jgi:hypothetical protein